MRPYRYSKFIPNPLDQLDLEDLLDQLKEFLLQSGFPSPFSPYGRPGEDLQGLLQALAEILSREEGLPQQWREALQEFAQTGDPQQLPREVSDFLRQVLQRLEDEGYLRIREAPEGAPPPSHPLPGEMGTDLPDVRFELTDKGVDFLGYKTLRELLSSLGRSSFGRHDTRELATGIASDAPSRPYEFGDNLNLDVTATLLRVIQRKGLRETLPLDYQDLMVYQTEYTSSCATVLMLDCSHSMILYGEDRFTPAKKVALALAHLIRTQYPGDTLHVVLFHDHAEEIPLPRLARVRVGPYHTNTREGLRLSRRILLNQRKDMRQIVMITDGKPSALTLEDGRIYKNPFGLDPLILQATFQEAAECRKSQILINTFMLARDFHLVDFVKKVARISRGKAYFATALNLANYILMDFLPKKTKMVH